MSKDLVQENINTSDVRHNWTLEEVSELYNMPFNDLIFRSHSMLRKYNNPNSIKLSTLCNIKQAGCPEDCTFCNQSAHHNKQIAKKAFVGVESIVKDAKRAKEKGATRFCMVAAWRGVHDKYMPELIESVKAVKALGMETCLSAGFLKEHHAKQLKDAGLEYYNHNIETSEDYYPQICSTHKFSDRMQTLKYVADAGIENCAGGIVGMGESSEDRLKMLISLANLPKHPKSVPLNRLIKFPDGPSKEMEGSDDFEFIKIVAVARILMPLSFIRFSAGRRQTSPSTQALCYFAGINSIHFGPDLLTSPNQLPEKDAKLFDQLGVETC